MTRESELESRLAAAAELIGRLRQWTDEHGAALVPHGGFADTYGDGVRACKRQVEAILANAPAAPTRIDHERAVLEAATDLAEFCRRQLDDNVATPITVPLNYRGIRERTTTYRKARLAARRALREKWGV